MSELPHTTSNGFEIEHPREKLDAAGFKDLTAEYGFTGQDPSERLDNLRHMSPDHVAFFLTDLNRRLQGSNETLVSDQVVKVGEKGTIAPEERAKLFIGLINKIKAAEHVSPARAGDTLGLGILLLHPFRDGNGRTSRMMALMFRDEFDQPDYEADFYALAESRDEVRAVPGRIPVASYIPYLPEGADQSNVKDVEAYFDTLLHDAENPRLYMGVGGRQAPLHPSNK